MLSISVSSFATCSVNLTGCLNTGWCAVIDFFMDLLKVVQQTVLEFPGHTDAFKRKVHKSRIYVLHVCKLLAVGYLPQTLEHWLKVRLRVVGVLVLLERLAEVPMWLVMDIYLALRRVVSKLAVPPKAPFVLTQVMICLCI